ncbi:hypothetical protein Patl1_35149 [Pistacia atlantica]|uniref:Uncharacterized protein n=1 Tax=Pistacia atlantica TaxID=434234 RepID=A0ACC0ZT65_9ROSI|nr:hypothetical protein Patl1_35149 [Pistacia atlantica]
MQQPPPPNPQPKSTTTNPQKKKTPSPQELITHYTTQGLDQQQASLKVIEDLQNVLFRVIASTNKNRKDKVDSKPGFAQTFGLGIVSGAALNGIGSALPHVVKGFGQIWTAVRTATDPSSSSNGPS